MIHLFLTFTESPVQYLGVERAYLIYIKLTKNEFGNLALAALADHRVRGEFKTWAGGKVTSCGHHGRRMTAATFAFASRRPGGALPCPPACR